MSLQWVPLRWEEAVELHPHDSHTVYEKKMATYIMSD